MVRSRYHSVTMAHFLFLFFPLLADCPNNCNGHGSCKKGSCDCDNGWYGAGCDQCPPNPNSRGKWTLCHGTSSDSNPYVQITIDESAVGTHLSGHGPNNWPD